MTQRLATYNRAYSTRSCRQQCFYNNGIAATENVLAAVSGDGHEAAQDFTLNYEDNSRLHNYKLLQQQIIGHTIQSVEDIEKWLRHTSEHISKPEINVKNSSRLGQERSFNEKLSEVSDKELLTDIEQTARKLNIDYDAILTELQNNKFLPANEKDDDFTLPDLRLDDLILTHEISAICSQLESSNTDVKSKNLIDTSQNCSDVEKTVEIAQLQNEIKRTIQNTETELINNVDRDSFDATLTMSIQDLSIENDSSDGSCDPNNCNLKSAKSNMSENLNSSVVQNKTARYNTRSKSTNSSNIKSKCEPSLIKRKRKVNNQENTVKSDKNNTVSITTVLPVNENVTALIAKSQRSSTSESSGSESDDLYRGRHPSFVTEQELIISKALEEVGITENTLEYFYNSANLKTWRCHLKDCGRQFAKLCYLKFHLMAHMNVKPFKCDYSGCSWAFYSEFKLKRHKEIHLNKKDFICHVPGCQRRFTTIYNLNSHEKLHTRPNIACQVSGCIAKFQTKRALENHMKCHNDNLASYACNYEGCDRQFYSSNALMSHKRCHSYSKEDLVCSWPDCGKTFDMPSRKRTHMLTHTGPKQSEKSYACTFKGCGWTFIDLSKLKRHQRKHTNDRKFACDEEGCTKTFLRLQHLEEHKRRHAKDRKLKCHYCDTCFAVKSNLYVHIKSHIRKMCSKKLEKKRNVEKKTYSNSNRKKISIESSGFESGSTDEMENMSSVSKCSKMPVVTISESENTLTEKTDNISLASNCANMPVANVLLQKMYKCPVESCTKWYSYRSTLRVHLRKHTSPLSEIQNGNKVNLEESTTSNSSNSKSNEGAARTEFTCEYVLSLKPDRQIVGLNEVGTVELSEGLLVNQDLPSMYCEEDVDLLSYQILPFDASPIDGIQALD